MKELVGSSVLGKCHWVTTKRYLQSSGCKKGCKCSQRQKEKSHYKRKNLTKKCKRSDNLLQSRLDYSHHDGGPNALDVSPDLPVSDLHDLMASYYLAHVKVTESAATKIMIDTTGQGDDNSKIPWHEERRK